MLALPENAHMRWNPPATDADIQAAEARLGVRFPAEYRELLRLADGAEADDREFDSLLLYGTEALDERNATWETFAYAPGFLAIGDTGGGDVLAISLSSEPAAVSIVDSGAMSPECMEELAPSLKAWLADGCRTRADG